MSTQSSETSNGHQLERVSTVGELMAESSTPLNNEDVAALAYQRWMERGCPLGSPEEDWFEAEHELQSRPGAA
jgi:Protein of unknown function (DUF2934)